MGAERLIRQDPLPSRRLMPRLSDEIDESRPGCIEITEEWSISMFVGLKGRRDWIGGVGFCEG